jgi:hypothetical protein
MQFQQWFESTLLDLYQSTVAAFPHTTKRQFVTDNIKIVDLTWTPYLGVETLFVKGRAVNEGRHYQPLLLFKKVQYYAEKNHPDLVEIVASNDKKYVFEKLQYKKNDVLLRCDCPDFRYRFAFYNAKEHALYGKSTGEAKGIVNPLELPGMCKHLLKLVTALDHAGILEG